MQNKENENRNPAESLREERKEEMLREYEREVSDIQRKVKEQEADVKRPLPKASDYVLPGEETDPWDTMTDTEKKKEVEGDLRSGWSKWGNLLIAAVVVGVIILFKVLI
ncbi:MAG: hypothetical protein LKG42_04955 [Eubacterium sp.]|jgi:uncharacterized membrane protein YukC|nr:hypothetical protein [Eubacterium sp.]MCH4046474.1 hypothetical protein [Eubacterium sp.]MCH4079569.1 hypothetical protein [Eubacterium sp.]MCH4111149.1 hypothetical protein [Eubacterium sp.]MCI1307347.1 hypothetical protein [Eubacterium sp.]